MAKPRLARQALCATLWLILSLLLLCPPVSAQNADAEGLEVYIDEIFAWKLAQAGADSAQALLDTALADQAGASPAEWYTVAIRQYRDGETYDYSAYASALAAAAEDPRGKTATDLQRIAMALCAAGEQSAFVQSTVDTTPGQLGIMSEIYGLLLMDCTGEEGLKSAAFTRGELVDTILSQRLGDGGWALTGAVSDVDVTAMALQALAPYRDSREVGAAIEGALTLLSERQLEGGDFASFGTPNCESTAQVLAALSALGIDYREDARFSKSGNTVLSGLLRYRLPGGDYAHITDAEGASANDTASVQALYALISAWRMESGLGALYGFDSQGGALAPQEPAQTTQTAQSDEEPAGDAPRPLNSYKPYGYLAIGLAAALAIGGLTLRKRRRCALLALIVALAASLALALADIQSVEEYYLIHIDDITPQSETISISIRCDTVAGEAEHIPASGAILAATDYVLRGGDTVYDMLVRATRHNKIQLEAQSALGTTYIKGMGYLYEYDFGELSGWMYRVNGEYPGVGCSDYVLRDGDVVEWVYTRDLGKDVGG